jgi:shikimate kinase
MKIYLVGFMGCGKTTYGKALAKALNFNFLDLDEEIVRISGISINDLFLNSEPAFRELETNTLLKTNLLNNYVIATGGGTTCFDKNMEWMKKNGITVYLKFTVKELLDRLISEKNQRPLLKDIPNSELLDYIQNSLRIRKRFYNKANIIINLTDSCSILPERIYSLVNQSCNQQKNQFLTDH